MKVPGRRIVANMAENPEALLAPSCRIRKFRIVMKPKFQCEIAQVTLEIVQGDITRQEDMDAVVNAANAELMPGGGVAGAIHRAAGKELAAACKPLAPINPGEAVITDGFNLPNPRIIHCLGPIYGVNHPADELLRNCYENALKLAEDQGLKSIAFPAISTGAFGYPMEDATKIALQTIKETAPNLNSVKTIRFVLFDEPATIVHENLAKEII